MSCSGAQLINIVIVEVARRQSDSQLKSFISRWHHDLAII